MGREDVRIRGAGRPPRGAEVGARERLPVGRVYAPSRGFEGIRRNKDSLRSLGFRVGAMTYGISENFMLSK